MRFQFVTANNLEAVGNNGNGEEKKFVLNTTNCKIPEFVPWSRSAELLQTKCTPYFRNKPNCEKNRIHSWTYMNGSVFVNLSTFSLFAINPIPPKNQILDTPRVAFYSFSI